MLSLTLAGKLLHGGRTLEVRELLKYPDHWKSSFNCRVLGWSRNL